MSLNYNVRETVPIKTNSLRETRKMEKKKAKAKKNPKTSYSCLRKAFPSVGSYWIMS